MLGRLLMVGAAAYAAKKFYDQRAMKAGTTARVDTPMDGMHDSAIADDDLQATDVSSSSMPSTASRGLSASSAPGDPNSEFPVGRSATDDELGRSNNLSGGTNAQGSTTLSPERGPGPMQ